MSDYPMPHGPVAVRTPHPSVIVGQAQSTAFASGKNLIVLHYGVLPDRCIKCNGVADAKPYKKRYYWHHPAWYLLILLALLLYAIVALCIRKDMKLVIPMCRQHRKQRMVNTLIWVGALVLGVVMFVAAAATESVALLLLGLILFLGGLIYGLVVSHLLVPRFMDDYLGKFTGAGPAYLASLPKWQGREPG